MANAFTSTTTWADLVETAYDRMVEFALRSVPQFRDVIDKRPAQQAMPGDVVTLTIHNDLPVNTTPLTETVDPDAVAMPAPDRVSITLEEYGMATLSTIKLSEVAFTHPDQEKVELIARNQADTLDKLVQNVLSGASNKLMINGGNVTSSGAFDSVTTTDIFTAALLRTGVTKMRSGAVQPRRGDSFVAYMHPDVSFDLQGEAASNGNVWLTPHQYVDTQALYRGEAGTFGGAIIIETPRCTSAVNANASPATVYNTYLLGRQAVAEANAIEPHSVVGPQTDKLKRFNPLGWYGLLGWSIYRQEALELLQTSSSVAGV